MESLKALVSDLGMQTLTQPWLPKVVAVVLGTLILHYAAQRALQHLARLASRSVNDWDDAVVGAAKRPLPIMIWVLGIALAADIVRRHSGEAADPLFAYVPAVREVGVVVCLAWFLLRLIRLGGRHYVENRRARDEEVDQTTIDALSKLGRLTILVSATLVIMQALGFSVSGLLAAGGIGGIAVGFAAKDLLANFFGGLTIYLDRPFSVGDWIRSPDKQIEGTVEYISWRHTRIRAFNKNPIYVPNALFTTIVVENPSRMTHRRINETIGIRYDDLAAMPAIVADVKAMLAAHPEIDQSQTLIVNFNAFAASSLDFFIYAYTRTILWVKYHEVKQDVLLKIADIIAAHGAEIAFPTRTLHLQSDADLDAVPRSVR